MNINENGAGYATKPFVAVVGTGCTIIPRIKSVSMNNDKIDAIELEGGLCATTVPTLAIEAPNRIKVDYTLSEQSYPESVYFSKRAAATLPTIKTENIPGTVVITN